MSMTPFSLPHFLVELYLYCDCCYLALAIYNYLGNDAKLMGVYLNEGQFTHVPRHVFVKYRGKCIDVMGIYEDEDAFLTRSQPVPHDGRKIHFTFDTATMNMDYIRDNINQERMYTNQHIKELSEEDIALESTNIHLLVGEIEQLQFVFQLIQPKLRLLLE
jgi:hypothetical protein